MLYVSEMVWHELKEFLRNEWKPHNLQELKDGITRFWNTRMTPEKCRRYISHLRKVVPKIVELKGEATGM